MTRKKHFLGGILLICASIAGMQCSSGAVEEDINASIKLQYTDGSNMSTATNEEYSPVILENDFYFAENGVSTDVYIRHSRLQPDGRFQDLGRLQLAGGDADITQINSYFGFCEAILHQGLFYGLRINYGGDSQRYLGFIAKQTSPGVGSPHSICFIPIDENGAFIETAAAVKISLGGDGMNLPVGAYFSAGNNLVIPAWHEFTRQLREYSLTITAINGDRSFSATLDNPETSGSYGTWRTFATNETIEKTGYYRLQIFGADEELLIAEKRVGSQTDVGLFVVSNKEFAPISFLNTTANEGMPSVDATGHIYFSSTRDGTSDLFRLNRPSIPEMSEILISLFGGGI